MRHLTKIYLLSLALAGCGFDSAFAQVINRATTGVTESSTSHSGIDGFDIPLDPSQTVYFLVNVKNSSELDVGLIYRHVPPGIFKARLDRIRFLSVKAVQEDLKLSKSSVNRLAQIVEKLDRFERVDRWAGLSFGGVVVNASRESAEKDISQFFAALGEVEDGSLLSREQLLRLEQIRLRFRCVGSETADERITRPRDLVLKGLRLTSEQEAVIREIVAAELGDILDFKTQFDEISSVLQEDQKTLFESYVKPFFGKRTAAALSLAQCSDALGTQPSAVAKKEEWPPMLMERALLTMAGKFAPENSYLELGSPTPRFIWRSVHRALSNHEFDWLELSQGQLEEIKNLCWTDENNVVQYYGGDRVRLDMERPESDWSVEKLRLWKDRYLDETTKADEMLGYRIKEVLLPRQIAAIHSAISLQRVLDLGPYFVAINFRFSESAVSQSDLKVIEKLRSERRKKLLAKFETIEIRVRRELSPEQREWVARHFGDYCSLYPAVWLFLVP